LTRIGIFRASCATVFAERRKPRPDRQLFSSSSTHLASSTRSLKSSSSDAGSAASLSLAQPGKAPKRFSISRRKMVSSPS
jgi:hypothetical protein